MKSLQEILKAKNIRPSHHRLKILQYLQNNRTHPTVEGIYSALIKEVPTLSRTTIYNTLQTFLDHGLISGLTISGSETRYDFNNQAHSHLYCRKCYQVFDLPEIKCPCDKGKIDGHLIDDVHLYFKGVCKKCLKKGG